MTADPYAGYADAVVRIVDQTLAAMAQAGADEPPELDFYVKNAVYEEQEVIDELADRTWMSRAQVEQSLADENRSALRALDSMVGLSHAFARLLLGGRSEELHSVPESVGYASSMVLTRSLSIGHEICALLRAGFPAGARGRWRTLYELAVVAEILHVGNRGTAARYANHRWIRLAKSPDDYFSPQDWASTEVERMSKKFIRRYGSAFSGTYGWAAELTKRKLGVAHPKFGHLEEIAKLDWSSSIIASAHHSVHADSIGGLGTVNAAGVFHSGARLGGIAEMCLLTIDSLGVIDRSVLGTWLDYAGPFTDRASRLNVLAQLSEEVRLSLLRDCLASVTHAGPANRG
jgi:hypothetical protein